MKYTIKELAQMVNGVVEGKQDKVIRGVAGLQEAGENEITFAVEPYLEYLHLAKAGALVVASGVKVTTDIPLIRVENPRASFAVLSQAFNPTIERDQGVHPGAFVDITASVHPSATVMAGAYVGPKAQVAAEVILYPQSYVGDFVIIGEKSILYPGAVVREHCKIGARVILQPGAVIGADGFGFVLADGVHQKVPQVGKVIIGDDVEVGANSTIDRGTLGDTIVGAGTKIDNLVHLGHNVQTGKHGLFVALTGISGSTIIGDYCTFGGQSATKGHIKIGDRCMFAGRSGISNNVPSDSIMAGFPLQPHREWLRKEVALSHITELVKRVRTLETEIQKLKPNE